MLRSREEDSIHRPELSRIIRQMVRPATDPLAFYYPSETLPVRIVVNHAGQVDLERTLNDVINLTFESVRVELVSPRHAYWIVAATSPGLPNVPRIAGSAPKFYRPASDNRRGDVARSICMLDARTPATAQHPCPTNLTRTATATRSSATGRS